MADYSQGSIEGGVKNWKKGGDKHYLRHSLNRVSWRAHFKTHIILEDSSIGTGSPFFLTLLDAPRVSVVEFLWGGPPQHPHPMPCELFNHGPGSVTHPPTSNHRSAAVAPAGGGNGKSYKMRVK